jgi:hypothetical protein
MRDLFWIILAIVLIAFSLFQAREAYPPPKETVKESVREPQIIKETIRETYIEKPVVINRYIYRRR